MAPGHAAGAQASGREASTEPAMESVMIEESDIEEQAAAEPAASPAPTTPAAPAREKRAEINAGTKSESKSEPWVPQARVNAPRGRTPHVGWIVNRNVHNLRVGRLNFDGVLAALIFSGDHLLLRIGEPAIGPSARTHTLHGIHHIILLSQERVAEIGGPVDVAAQQMERIRQRDESLNARVPALLLGGVH